MIEIIITVLFLLCFGIMCAVPLLDAMKKEEERE